MPEIEGNIAPLVEALLNPISILEAYSSLDIVLADSQQLESLNDIVAKPVVIVPLYLSSLILTLLGEALNKVSSHQLLAVAPQSVSYKIKKIAHTIKHPKRE